jgi:hypothetical protein
VRDPRHRHWPHSRGRLPRAAALDNMLRPSRHKTRPLSLAVQRATGLRAPWPRAGGCRRSRAESRCSQCPGPLAPRPQSPRPPAARKPMAARRWRGLARAGPQGRALASRLTDAMARGGKGEAWRGLQGAVTWLARRCDGACKALWRGWQGAVTGLARRCGVAGKALWRGLQGAVTGQAGPPWQGRKRGGWGGAGEGRICRCSEAS